ncbi:uncharacterized protein LOC113686016 [Pocillopora damicornis]|uniref:uncharacterized protein LOC113686016 n=1 Tax=Pocillopora damicornis TaxID=46731 RepID=UPI000F550739|nr:uncharacterized protein LOC113686016 [Pocillopora damicornis]
MSVKGGEKRDLWHSTKSFDEKLTKSGVAYNPYNSRKGHKRKKSNANEKDREEEGTEKTGKIKQRPSSSQPGFPSCTKERKKGNADEKDREEELTEKACKIKQRPSYSLPEFPRYTKVAPGSSTDLAESKELIVQIIAYHF